MIFLIWMMSSVAVFGQSTASVFASPTSGSPSETVNGRVAAILESGNRLSLQTGSQLITVFLNSRTDISVGGPESHKIAPTSLRPGDELEVLGELSTDHERMLARSITLNRRIAGETSTSDAVSHATSPESTK